MMNYLLIRRIMRLESQTVLVLIWKQAPRTTGMSHHLDLRDSFLSVMAYLLIINNEPLKMMMSSKSISEHAGRYKEFFDDERPTDIPADTILESQRCATNLA